MSDTKLPGPVTTDADRIPISISEGVLEKDISGKLALVGGKCTACSALMFPLKAVCPMCMSEDVITELMSSTGRLYSYTTVYVGSDKWIKPSTLAYVDLTNGVRVFARIVGDLSRIQIDQTVELDVGIVGKQSDGTPISSFVFRPME